MQAVKWFEENRLPAAFQARMLQKMTDLFPKKEIIGLEDLAALKRFERSFQPLLDEHNKAAMMFEGTSIEDWKKHFKYDHNLLY